MNTTRTRNSRVAQQHLITPNGLRLKAHCSGEVIRPISSWRNTLAEIISGRDQRLAVIVGPCSVHNTASVLDYVERLDLLTHSLKNIFLIVRLAGEKPRTALGWPGFIQCPDLRIDRDGNLERGLLEYRRLLIKVAELGIPVATEVLDPDILQYHDELLTAVWIGARTVTTPHLRYAASGLSMPVLFKNGVSGSIEDASNAVRVASNGAHSFASIDDDGRKAVFHTKGNPDCTIVLRGGSTPNYDQKSILRARKLCGKQIFVDVSHANSGKDHSKQPGVAHEVARLKGEGLPIGGILIESFIKPGAQQIRFEAGDVVCPDTSLTDGCLGFDETVKLLREIDRIVG